MQLKDGVWQSKPETFDGSAVALRVWDKCLAEYLEQHPTPRQIEGYMLIHSSHIFVNITLVYGQYQMHKEHFTTEEFAAFDCPYLAAALEEARQAGADGVNYSRPCEANNYRVRCDFIKRTQQRELNWEIVYNPDVERDITKFLKEEPEASALGKDIRRVCLVGFIEGGYMITAYWRSTRFIPRLRVERAVTDE